MNLITVFTNNDNIGSIDDRKLKYNDFAGGCVNDYIIKTIAVRKTKNAIIE